MYVANNSGDPLNSFRVDGYIALYLVAQSTAGATIGYGLPFQTSPAGVAMANRRMTIAPDGNIGIGTTGAPIALRSRLSSLRFVNYR